MLNLLPPLRDSARPALLGGDIVLTEHAIAALRRHLESVGLAEWRIFQGPVPHLHGIDLVLDRLDASALWESPEASLVGEEPMVAVTFEDRPRPHARAWQGGVLHLRQLQVIVARWYWFDSTDGRTVALYLLAAPQLECLQALRQRLIELNREPRQPVWRISQPFGEDSTVPRDRIGDDALVLSDALRQRVRTDILGFFTPAVAAMYRRLNVPYRRGVLLYGEPGNGKTSLIRYVGAQLPNVAALLLRASAKFNTDTLSHVFNDWKQMAPALLVIEDLTTIVERVNLSTFLNLLDGVDRKIGGGLMLIASTNHPDRLDPALSNRPGRFDVVMELPPPDEHQRRLFLRSRLLELDIATIELLVADTPRMSFAHLDELVQLSGMIAIREDREYRVAADVTAALDQVRCAFNTAQTGYAKLPEVPFGLAGLRKSRP